jgi:hypothetical protein
VLVVLVVITLLKALMVVTQSFTLLHHLVVAEAALVLHLTRVSMEVQAVVQQETLALSWRAD